MPDTTVGELEDRALTCIGVRNLSGLDISGLMSRMHRGDREHISANSTQILP